MSKPTDIRVTRAQLCFLPVTTRVPLKFGTEVTQSITCARVRVEVETSGGGRGAGWGETPLSVVWAWPSAAVGYEDRHEAMRAFCRRLGAAWNDFDEAGHALEVGHAFNRDRLGALLADCNAARPAAEPMPHLAALICNSAFDIAVHDAYGVANDVPVYDTYTAEWLNADLAAYLEPAADAPDDVDFAGRHPGNFLAADVPTRLPAWHLVGGKDLLEDDERTGAEPDDGYPVTLREWVRRDGLKCLKVKLRGNDAPWDYDRLVRVGTIAVEEGADWLTADFNCTVTDPAYVNDILDRLRDESPRLHGMILYVEQPFPYDLEAHRIDVRSVSARKPLFMDESAHDWRMIRLGRSLGWTGVALKTCKTQTGALLSLCWAKAHSMTRMVQDLTNPMLAQVPHVLLAAHAETIMGVETNAMQFYPEASAPEAVVHPGLYTRREGHLDLRTLAGPGFGYRADEIDRALPAWEELS